MGGKGVTLLIPTNPRHQKEELSDNTITMGIPPLSDNTITMEIPPCNGNELNSPEREVLCPIKS